MKRLLFAALILIPCMALAEPLTVFKGRPSVKISEGGTARTPENLDQSKAINLGCVISRIGEEYYWASRENTPLTAIDNGFFITFVAQNGSGYVRIIKNDKGVKNTVAMMSETEKEYDYVEHLILGLRSVTYYGKAQ